MKKIYSIILSAVVTAAITSTAFAGSVEKVIITIDKTVENATDNPKPSRKSGKSIQAPSGDMDTQFIKSDEYFTSIRPLKGVNSDVQIAKMITPPSDKTKGEAQFMDSYKGTEFWTKNYWKTRIASEEDLKVGKTIIYWGRYAKNHVYFAPRDQKEARNISWRLAKITDTGDLFKGEVTVAGNKRVAIDSIRVIE